MVLWHCLPTHVAALCLGAPISIPPSEIRVEIERSCVCRWLLLRSCILRCLYWMCAYLKENTAKANKQPFPDIQDRRKIPQTRTIVWKGTLFLLSGKVFSLPCFWVGFFSCQWPHLKLTFKNVYQCTREHCCGVGCLYSGAMSSLWTWEMVWAEGKQPTLVCFSVFRNVDTGSFLTVLCTSWMAMGKCIIWGAARGATGVCHWHLNLMRSARRFLLVISKYFVWKNFKTYKITQPCYINISGQKQLPDLMFNVSSPACLILGLQQS